MKFIQVIICFVILSIGFSACEEDPLLTNTQPEFTIKKGDNIIFRIRNKGNMGTINILYVFRSEHDAFVLFPFSISDYRDDAFTATSDNQKVLFGGNSNKKSCPTITFQILVNGEIKREGSIGGGGPETCILSIPTGWNDKNIGGI